MPKADSIPLRDIIQSESHRTVNLLPNGAAGHLLPTACRLQVVELDA
jgi:hypothetical protein